MNTKIINTIETIAKSVDPIGSARIAAAIVVKNELIALGFNKKKSHPFQRKFAKNPECIFLHAEIDAIKNAIRDYDERVLKKSTLYITRMKHSHPTDKNFILGLAKPCSGCMRAIVTFDIKQVIYSTENEGYVTL